MEKVKLTQEQIQTVRNFMNNHNVLKLSLNELHRVIDGEYEVKETFKVGDLVIHEIGELFGEVTRIYEDKLEVTRLGDEYIWSKKYVRHATPEEIAEEKQRRWWAKHGRKPLELKINDVLLRNDGGYLSVFHVDESQERYELVARGDHQSGYEVDKEKINAFYKVICFAEDCKDLEGGR